MNEIIKAMKETSSIRSFKPDMVPKELVDQIIEAGLHAPSGMNFQESVILAFTDKEARDRLSEANRKIGGWDEGFDPFYGAPVVLTVLADTSKVTWQYDGTLVMGYLLLAAHSLGLGSIWIHRAKEEFEQEEYKELLKSLGLTGEYEGIGHCAIGYINGDVPARAPRNDGRVYYI